jgi:hypothetical protein
MGPFQVECIRSMPYLGFGRPVNYPAASGGAFKIWIPKATSIVGRVLAQLHQRLVVLGRRQRYLWPPYGSFLVLSSLILGRPISSPLRAGSSRKREP